MTTKYAITTAPEYAIHREDIDTADTMSAVVKRNGINSESYRYVHVQVVPESGANPNVAVHYWSEQADVFIQNGSIIVGAGVNTPYEFTIEPMGRIFFIQVQSISTGTVTIVVSGYERRQFS